MGQPLVFPHGVTVYNPEKCWSGYTIVPLINDGVLLFDMNGNEVRRWNMHAMPPKLLPGGYVMGLSGYRHPDYGMQDGVNLIEIDYDGNIVWEFDHFENIDDLAGTTDGWRASIMITRGRAIRLVITYPEWMQSPFQATL